MNDMHNMNRHSVNNAAFQAMTKCDIKGCGHDATFAPKICVPFTNLSESSFEPVCGILGMRLCVRHATDMTTQELFKTLPDLQNMFEHCAGLDKVKPFDWSRAYIEKVKLDSKEFFEFQTGSPVGNA